MRALESCGYAGAGIPACIHDVSSVMMLCLIQQGLDSRLGEAPCACVEGFFLCPDNSFGVGVGVEVLAQLGPGEGVQLLDAGDGCGFE